MGLGLDFSMYVINTSPELFLKFSVLIWILLLSQVSLVRDALYLQIPKVLLARRIDVCVLEEGKTVILSMPQSLGMAVAKGQIPGMKFVTVCSLYQC